MNQVVQKPNQIRREVWRGQLRLLQDHTKFRHALVAGNGYGKSYFFPVWHHERCVLNRNSKYSLVVGLKYDLLKHLNLPYYIEFLESIGYREGMHFTVNRSEMYLTYNWGHTILFRSAESGKKLVSYNCSHTTRDEPGLMSEAIDIECVKRTRCGHAKVNQILDVGTPEGINHFAKLFGLGAVTRETDKHGNLLKHSVAENKLVLHGTTYDNTTLKPEFIQNLLDAFGWNDNFRRAYINGEFVPLFERNCYEFTDKNVIDCKPRESVPTLYLSFDFNVGQVTWGAFQRWDGKHFLVKENPRRCRDTDQACDQFIAAFPSSVWGTHEIIITGDMSGYSGNTRTPSSDYDIIRDRLRAKYPNMRIVAPHANPSVRPSIVAVNRLFAKAFLYFDRDCSKFIESAQTTIYDGKGDIAKPSGETWTHAMDTCRYYVELVAPIRARRIESY